MGTVSKFPKFKNCPDCRGKGTYRRACNTCGGRRNRKPEEGVCEVCQGQLVFDVDCGSCNASGRVQVD